MNVIDDGSSDEEKQQEQQQAQPLPAAAARAGVGGPGDGNRPKPNQTQKRNPVIARGDFLTHGSENRLAESLKATGELEETEPQCRLLVDRCTNPLDIIQAILNLAAVLQAQNRLGEAETLLRKGLKKREQALGVDHPHTIQSRHNLAELLMSQGKLEESEDVWRQTIRGYEESLGRNHPQTLVAMYKLSVCLEAQDETEEAETLYRETLGRYQNSLGLDHPNALACVSGLGLLLLGQGRLQESEPLLRQAADRCRSVFGPDHPDTLAAVYNLVCNLSRCGERDEARKLANDGLETSILNFGKDHPITMRFQNQIHKAVHAPPPPPSLPSLIGDGSDVGPFVPENTQQIDQSIEPEYGCGIVPQETPISGFEHWVAQHKGERTLEQEMELAMHLSAKAENSNTKLPRGDAVQATRDLEKTPICGVDSLVTWKGIHVGWFLDVFCSTPYVRTLIEFDCQMWFVRKVCIIEIIKRAHFRRNGTHAPILSGSFLDFLETVISGFGLGGDVEKTVKTPTTFISYGGGCTLREMLEVLQQLDPNEYIWVDFLCLNHFAWTGKSKTPELQPWRVSFLDELQHQIKSINNTILVLEKWDNAMQTMGQIRVLWEIFCTAEAGGKIQVLLPPQQSKDFVENCLESSEKLDSIMASLSSIDASKIIAQGDSEDQAIHERMKVAGLSKVHSLVASAVRGWMLKEGRQQPDERRSGKRAPSIVFLNNLARLLRDQGKPKEAAPLCREAFERQFTELGFDHPGTLIAANNLASLLHDLGRFREAEALYREVLEKSERVHGSAHPETITSINNLACLLENQGRAEEAVLMHRAALEKRQEVLGSNHPSTLNSMDNLAGLLRSQGLFEEAELLHREALNKKQKVLGLDHPETAHCLDNLARLLHSSGKLEEAEPLYREAFQKLQKVLGPDHPESMHSLNNLACLFHDQGRLQETEPLYREILERRSKILGPDHPETLTAMNNLACLLENRGRLEEAELMHREALMKRQKTLGPDHPSTLNSMNNLVGLLQSLGVGKEVGCSVQETSQTKPLRSDNQRLRSFCGSAGNSTTKDGVASPTIVIPDLANHPPTIKNTHAMSVKHHLRATQKTCEPEYSPSRARLGHTKVWVVEHVIDELEAACQERPLNHEKIQSLVRARPVERRGKDGWLALHRCCRRKPSLATIKCLVEAYPNSLTAWTEDGFPELGERLPVHIACQYGASLPVIKYLVGKADRTAFQPCKHHKMTALDYAYERKTDMITSGNEPDNQKVIDWLEYFILPMFRSAPQQRKKTTMRSAEAARVDEPNRNNHAHAHPRVSFTTTIRQLPEEDDNAAGMIEEAPSSKGVPPEDPAKQAAPQASHAPKKTPPPNFQCLPRNTPYSRQRSDASSATFLHSESESQESEESEPTEEMNLDILERKSSKDDYNERVAENRVFIEFHHDGKGREDDFKMAYAEFKALLQTSNKFHEYRSSGKWSHGCHPSFDHRVALSQAIQKVIHKAPQLGWEVFAHCDLVNRLIEVESTTLKRGGNSSHGDVVRRTNNPELPENQGTHEAIQHQGKEEEKDLTVLHEKEEEDCAATGIPSLAFNQHGLSKEEEELEEERMHHPEPSIERKVDAFEHKSFMADYDEHVAENRVFVEFKKEDKAMTVVHDMEKEEEHAESRVEPPESNQCAFPKEEEDTDYEPVEPPAAPHTSNQEEHALQARNQKNCLAKHWEEEETLEEHMCQARNQRDLPKKRTEELCKEVPSAQSPTNHTQKGAGDDVEGSSDQKNNRKRGLRYTVSAVAKRLGLPPIRPSPKMPLSASATRTLTPQFPVKGEVIPHDPRSTQPLLFRSFKLPVPSSTARPLLPLHFVKDEIVVYEATHSQRKQAKEQSEPQGDSPKGSLSIRVSNTKKCPGFGPSVHCISLMFTIPGGIQADYHYHAGKPFAGTVRFAYLPNNGSGRKLFTRILYAWKHGLIFTVGFSETRKMHDVVVWDRVPMKTGLKGGPFDFPDSDYIPKCHKALNELGVPDVSRDLANTPMSSPLVEPHANPPQRFMSLFRPALHRYVCPHTFDLPPGVGQCPSGTLSIRITDEDCPGFGTGTKCILLCYEIQAGRQQAYHPTPSMPFRGTTRITYLPFIEEGVELMHRLVCAWERGLVFEVGQSISRGETNVVRWSPSIPHKTSLNGGPYGFPSMHYVSICNSALDALLIPDAHQILNDQVL